MAATVAAFVMCATAFAGCAAPPDRAAPHTVTATPRGGIEETQIYRDSIDASWASIANMDPSAVRPDTAIIRYVTPQEQMQIIADCVREQGFSATLQPGGAITFGEVPPSQGTALNVAVFICEASYPLEDRFTLPPSEDQLKSLYAYLTDAAVPCLARLGFTPDPPPSLQQYLDTFYTADAWTPFASVSTGSADEWYDVLAACPQHPDNWWG